MKKIIVFLIAAAMLASLTACGSERSSEQASGSQSATDSIDTVRKDTDNNTEKDTENSHVLIAYFSVPEDVSTDGVDAIAGASIVVDDDVVKGNTEYIAETIKETIGGDLFQIETTEEYPLEHDALVDQAADEQDEAKRPELSIHVENFEQYETVILAFPNWWADLPMSVYSFLEEYDFGAKTIIPIVTHGGSGFSNTVQTISELQPGAIVRDNGLSIARSDVASSRDAVVAWAKGLGLDSGQSVNALPDENNTVAAAVPDAKNQQTLYLWEGSNMPSVTEYTENNGNYSDDPDFRPNIVSFPVKEGVDIKGAMLICAGGAFQFRSNQYEGNPVAEELSSLGYQCFVVNYRLRPYTQEEGALDLARAVRFVRLHAKEYGINEKDIGVMGFSAGGILSGEMLLNFDGTVNGTSLDNNYVPDALDQISADASADGMIYSFYGRLSVASTDSAKFAASDLPPTYFCYGTRDPFVGEFKECIAALQEAGVSVREQVLQNTPHGFGNTGGWIEEYDSWLTDIFASN